MSFEGMLSQSLFCVYLLAQDPILPDNTIVFIMGALNAPTGEAAFIDCNQRFTS